MQTTMRNKPLTDRHVRKRRYKLSKRRRKGRKRDVGITRTGMGKRTECRKSESKNDMADNNVGGWTEERRGKDRKEGPVKKKREGEDRVRRK